MSRHLVGTGPQRPICLGRSQPSYPFPSFHAAAFQRPSSSSCYTPAPTSTLPYRAVSLVCCSREGAGQQQHQKWLRVSCSSLRTASDLSGAGAGDDATIADFVQAIGRFLVSLYKFSRPHTMIGTTVSIASVSSLALQGVLGTDPSIPLMALTQALSSALLMNISIVGINQLFDIEIDKVNKPDLPLASGEWDPSTGLSVVAACTVASLAIGMSSSSPPLMATLVGSLLLGILYSCELPFMRWKRSPVLAAGCILAVRAILVQLGFFFHMRLAISSPAGASTATAAAAAAAASTFNVTPPLLFTVGFMLLFSIVIALFKDIPDVKGDTKAGVCTFSVRLGVPRVFWTCIGFLSAAYVGAIAFSMAGMVHGSIWKGVASIGGHAALLGLLWIKAKQVNLQKKRELTSFYMFIWKLFYSEYLLIPFLQ